MSVQKLWFCDSCLSCASFFTILLIDWSDERQGGHKYRHANGSDTLLDHYNDGLIMDNKQILCAIQSASQHLRAHMVLTGHNHVWMSGFLSKSKSKSAFEDITPLCIIQPVIVYASDL